MNTVTLAQLDVLHHTLGVTPMRRDPYRNYYVAGVGHHSQHILLELVADGLMAEALAPRFLADGDQVYRVTETGRIVALEQLPLPPKRSRYEEFLDADYGHSFAEWLCIEIPEVEWSGNRNYSSIRPDECYRYRRREFTRGERWSPEIIGEWKNTKKEAKASYKEALAAWRSRQKAWVPA